MHEPLQRAADSVSAVTKGYSGVAAQPPVSASNMPLYTDGNPLVGIAFEDKVGLLLGEHLLVVGEGSWAFFGKLAGCDEVGGF